jgi:hypothetical protein
MIWLKASSHSSQVNILVYCKNYSSHQFTLLSTFQVVLMHMHSHAHQPIVHVPSDAHAHSHAHHQAHAHSHAHQPTAHVPSDAHFFAGS